VVGAYYDVARIQAAAINSEIQAPAIPTLLETAILFPDNDTLILMRAGIAPKDVAGFVITSNSTNSSGPFFQGLLQALYTVAGVNETRISF